MMLNDARSMVSLERVSKAYDDGREIYALNEVDVEIKRGERVALLLGAANRDPEWVTQRVQQWQPTAKEKRWEGIGWAKDIRDAIRLGKQNQRPIFLFTHDGRLNVGRC